jgi:hypothetical protein
VNIFNRHQTYQKKDSQCYLIFGFYSTASRTILFESAL